MGRHETEQRHLDLLRAHFRAEETFVNKALNDIGYQLPFWRVHYRASAGDLDGVPEILIEDLVPRTWNLSSAQIWKTEFRMPVLDDSSLAWCRCKHGCTGQAWTSTWYIRADEHRIATC